MHVHHSHLRNCTNAFQPINVIFQCLFKYAFKKESYSWTCLTIKTQLNGKVNQ